MRPAWLRRPVSLTTWGLTALAGLAIAPLMLVAGRILIAVNGDRRLLAMTRILATYFIRGLGALVACGVLWLASGAGWQMRSGRFQALHWRLLGWFVGGVAAEIKSAVGIEIAAEDSAAAFEMLRREEPLIMFSRHAGPADTILLIDMLLSEFDRRPSVVFKEAVALEPTIDLITHRLPQVKLDTSDPEACEALVAKVTAELGPRGMLLLYPEGGNFTLERRRRALRSLRRQRELKALRRAQQMTHVLPPRPGGALAALAASPAAPVIFVAHTGLGLAAYPLQIWRALPLGRTYRTRMWLLGPDEVPAGDEARRDWLGEWWQRLDRWIEQGGEEDLREAV